MTYGDSTTLILRARLDHVSKKFFGVLAGKLMLARDEDCKEELNAGTHISNYWENCYLTRRWIMTLEYREGVTSRSLILKTIKLWRISGVLLIWDLVPIQQIWKKTVTNLSWWKRYWVRRDGWGMKIEKNDSIPTTRCNNILDKLWFSRWPL